MVSLLLRLSDEVDAVLTSVVPPCVPEDAPDSLRILGSPPREVVLRCEYGTMVSRGGDVRRSSRLARPASGASAPPFASWPTTRCATVSRRMSREAARAVETGCPSVTAESIEIEFLRLSDEPIGASLKPPAEVVEP